jgi:hypothetical protein
MNRWEKAIKEVADDMDIFCIILVIVFFPWSLLWLGMRVLQELEDE